MTFYAAFWSQGYWYQGYQTVPSQSAAQSHEVSGFGYKFPNPYREHKDAEYQREKVRKAKAELDRIAKELASAEAEQKRLESLKKAKKKAAKDRAAFLLLQEKEISRLREERIWLMRQIQEEESLLVLMLMASRRRLRLVAFN
jgi:hypothetical protein